MDEVPSGEPTLDCLLGGRLRLRQMRRGHRAGTDAILLAAAARPEPGDAFVDVGAGVGTVGLALALRQPSASGTLLEGDPATAALAEENCRLNGMDDRVRIACADLFDAAARRGAGLAEEAASLVVTNPPFLLAHRSRASPDAERVRAHQLDAAAGRTHGDWLRAALALLAPGGRLVLIHRADALPHLLAACEGRLGAVAVAPIHGRPEAPAIRIILSGRKGSRAPMAIGPGFVLHRPDGRFTPEAEAVHRGEALLPG